MVEIKVNLSVVLPGSTMLSKEECLKTIQKVITTKTGKKKLVVKEVEDWNKMDSHSLKVSDKNGANTEIITFHTRKSKPATQSMNISKEAYNYMIDKNACPEWSKQSAWNKMDKEERLKSHLQRTMEYLGGISYSYQVFED